jgi:hypothetical protein
MRNIPFIIEKTMFRIPGVTIAGKGLQHYKSLIKNRIFIHPQFIPGALFQLEN